MRRLVAGLFWLGILIGVGSESIAQHLPRYKALRFDQLMGWEQDDHTAALKAFLLSCEDISAPEWTPICKLAADQSDAKAFFEVFFTPVLVRPGKRALFTGYFEPALKGSRHSNGRYKYPIYKKPKNWPVDQPFPTRAEIDDGALFAKGLEIAFVEDPVEAYYLHIQGSGRITLDDGTTIRVGYAGENGHVYRSAARELVRLGEVAMAQASIAGLKAWAKRDPKRAREALQFNQSYVFFRELPVSDTSLGPPGALDRPITAMRSIAVDPRHTQMGAPVWIEKGGQDALRRLVIAQDVGSAIKGPQRADIFFGTGDDAGKQAGKTKDSGRMVVLLPHVIANRLAPEGG